MAGPVEQVSVSCVCQVLYFTGFFDLEAAKVWGKRGRSERGIGGAEGNRTLDLRIANATLSQLSYGPTLRTRILSCSYERHAKRRILPEFLPEICPTMRSTVP